MKKTTNKGLFYFEMLREQQKEKQKNYANKENHQQESLFSSSPTKKLGKQLAQSQPKSYLEQFASQKQENKIEKDGNQKRENDHQENSIQLIKNHQKKETLYYISSVIEAMNSNYKNETNKSHSQLIKEHFIQAIKHTQYRNDNAYFNQSKGINLKKADKYMNSKTILLDLDETLVHCNDTSFTPGDALMTIQVPNSNEKMDISLNVRPYASYFLQTLSKHFEVIIFTASHQYYADVILDYLDPDRKWISHRLYREHCLETDDGIFIKDLRSLSDMILVDNQYYSFAYQINNGILIIPYINNKQDTELKTLLNYLLKFKYETDVRTLNAKILQFAKFSEYKDPITLLKEKYFEYI